MFDVQCFDVAMQLPSPIVPLLFEGVSYVYYRHPGPRRVWTGVRKRSSCTIFLLINFLGSRPANTFSEKLLAGVLDSQPSNPSANKFSEILLAAVLVGGQIGNMLNLKIFPTRILALITAFLVIFVAIRIGVRII